MIKSNFLDKFFKLTVKGTNIKTEMLAGLTTFFAMAYIIFVNPAIMADAGVPKAAAFAATVYATVWASLLMGLWANYPVAIAPGMGLNALFAYYLCGALKLPWTVALVVVFFSGVIFLLLTFGGIRATIIRAIPHNLKSAIGVGVGLFIAFVGLENAGIVVSDHVTFVAMGNITKPEPLLCLFGVMMAAALMERGVKGSMLISIFVVTALGMVAGVVPIPHSWEQIISFAVPGISTTFMKLDFSGFFSRGLFSIVFIFVMIELFDNMGTLIGLTRKTGMMKANGEIEGLDKALNADAVATISGALLGTTPMNAYVENAAGISEGGRTGLTAVVVAVLFAVSLVFAPLVGLVPAFATAPALILVGALMMSEVEHVKFDDLTEGVPAFLTIIMMPLTFSIAEGFAFGFISYAILKLFTGRAREVHWIIWIIAVAFAAATVLKLMG
ncbi:MAG: NCS2 family permease [Negativicutes bacterium]